MAVIPRPVADPPWIVFDGDLADDPSAPPYNPPGDAAGLHYTHTQLAPAATWTVTHNLGWRPPCVVIVGGEEVETDIEYPDANTAVLTFPSPVTGTADFG